MTPRRSGSRPVVRRGVTSVLVLAFALLVTVIGVTSILAARLRFRTSLGAADVVKARYHARGIVEIALQRLAADPTWRTVYVHDAWTVEETAGAATYRFKLTDDEDGDLANDARQRVRLHGEAVVGGAVRVASVELRPDGTAIPNLLVNAGLEDGTTGWLGDVPPGLCDLEVRRDDPHGGFGSVLVRARSEPEAGPAQEVTDRLVNGATFYTEVWARGSQPDNEMTIQLLVQSSESGLQVFTVTDAWTGTTWTRVRGMLTPSWSGTLLRADWKLTTVRDAADFAFDDALLVEGADPPPIPLLPVRGSWR